MYFDSSLKNKVTNLIEKLEENDLKIVSAESCSGGLIAALFTEISGSSKVFERGFVTYSNESKNEILGVEESILTEFGAVSEETARKMAVGALRNSRADISVVTTGIAGPGGGSDEKPVGLVYIGCGSKEKVIVRKFNFSGDRDEVRKSVVVEALKMVEVMI